MKATEDSTRIPEAFGLLTLLFFELVLTAEKVRSI